MKRLFLFLATICMALTAVAEDWPLTIMGQFVTDENHEDLPGVRVRRYTTDGKPYYSVLLLDNSYSSSEPLVDYWGTDDLHVKFQPNDHHQPINVQCTSHAIVMSADVNGRARKLTVSANNGNERFCLNLMSNGSTIYLEDHVSEVELAHLASSVFDSNRGFVIENASSKRVNLTHNNVQELTFLTGAAKATFAKGVYGFTNSGTTSCSVYDRDGNILKMDAQETEDGRFTNTATGKSSVYRKVYISDMERQYVRYDMYIFGHRVSRFNKESVLGEGDNRVRVSADGKLCSIYICEPIDMTVPTGIIANPTDELGNPLDVEFIMLANCKMKVTSGPGLSAGDGLTIRGTGYRLQLETKSTENVIEAGSYISFMQPFELKGGTIFHTKNGRVSFDPMASGHVEYATALSNTSLKEMHGFSADSFEHLTYKNNQFYYSDGSVAKNLYLSHSEEMSVFPMTVLGKPVHEFNRHDILGDGGHLTASYSDTGYLTIHVKNLTSKEEQAGSTFIKVDNHKVDLLFHGKNHLSYRNVVDITSDDAYISVDNLEIDNFMHAFSISGKARMTSTDLRVNGSLAGSTAFFVGRNSSLELSASPKGNLVVQGCSPAYGYLHGGGELKPSNSFVFTNLEGVPLVYDDDKLWETDPDTEEVTNTPATSLTLATKELSRHILIAGKTVTIANESDFAGNKTITYNNGRKELVLNNATIEVPENATGNQHGIYVQELFGEYLTIVLRGENIIRVPSGAHVSGIRALQGISFTGTGSLRILAPGVEKAIDAKSISLLQNGSSDSGVSIEARGKEYGVYLTEQLGINRYCELRAVSDVKGTASVHCGSLILDSSLDIRKDGILCSYNADKQAVVESSGNPARGDVRFGMTSYDLWVGGVKVTRDNMNDILGGKVAQYTPSTRTLTLRDAHVPAFTDRTSTESSIFSVNSLNIVLDGTNVLDSRITTILGDLTIKGSGGECDSLYISCAGSPIHCLGLAIDSCSIELHQTGAKTLYGGSRYVVDNSNTSDCYLNSCYLNLSNEWTEKPIIFQGTSCLHSDGIYVYEGAIDYSSSLKARPAEKCVISISVNDPILGSVEGEGTYYEGQTATIKATPASENIDFLGWYRNGVLFSTDLEVSFPCIMSQNLEARFDYSTEGIEQVTTQTSDIRTRKCLEKGSILIQHGGRTYTLQGRVVR